MNPGDVGQLTFIHTPESVISKCFSFPCFEVWQIPLVPSLRDTQEATNACFQQGRQVLCKEWPSTKLQKRF